MILPKFEYHRPSRLAEAIRIAVECRADFDFIAGGTDLLPNYKQRLNPRGNLISLAGLRELAGIGADGAGAEGQGGAGATRGGATRRSGATRSDAARAGATLGSGAAEGGDANGYTRIGAAVTLTELAASPLLRSRFPALAGAAAQIASPLIQNAATLGGNLLVETRCFFFNQFPGWRQSLGYCLKAEGDDCWVVPQKSICYATYSGDLAPLLQVLGATLVLESSAGAREVAACAFYRPDGIAKNVKGRDEVIREVRIPAASATLRTAYRKLRIRDTLDFPSMGAAAALRMAGGKIETLRIAITAVDVVPLPMDEVTAPHVGEALTDALIEAIAADVEGRCRPLRNVPLSPPYRKKMVGVYVRDLLTNIRDSA